jgi:hypothetical protein
MSEEFKLEINGTEYELEESVVGSSFIAPFLIFNGKNYIGKAIPKQASKTLSVKDYEVLQYVTKNGISVEPVDAKWYAHPDYELKILSVRRLSDVEIFTINDITDKGKINAFEIAGNEMIAKFAHDYPGSCASGFCNIKFLSKLKQPIALEKKYSKEEIIEMIKSLLL